MPRSLTPVIVAGATGVGKSSFAVELASQLDGEIIGADAFQIYAGLPTLTAQPTEAEQRGIPHHLIGCVDVHESFHAAKFWERAETLVSEIQSRCRRPILCGGTGMYLKAFTHGLAEVAPASVESRAELERLSDEALRAELLRLDPAAESAIDFKNRRRVVRALEICRSTGRPVTEVRKEWQQPRRPFIALHLVRPREELRERIRQNVERMFAAGVVDEVKQNGEVGETAAKAIGFDEIQAALRGEQSLAECQERMVHATRQYAKRQLTWFRGQANYHVIPLTQLDSHFHPIQQAVRLAHD